LRTVVGYEIQPKNLKKYLEIWHFLSYCFQGPRDKKKTWRLSGKMGKGWEILPKSL